PLGEAAAKVAWALSKLLGLTPMPTGEDKVCTHWLRQSRHERSSQPPSSQTHAWRLATEGRYDNDRCQPALGRSFWAARYVEKFDDIARARETSRGVHRRIADLSGRMRSGRKATIDPARGIGGNSSGPARTRSRPGPRRAARLGERLPCLGEAA